MFQLSRAGKTVTVLNLHRCGYAGARIEEQIMKLYLKGELHFIHYLHTIPEFLNTLVLHEVDSIRPKQEEVSFLLNTRNKAFGN